MPEVIECKPFWLEVLLTGLGYKSIIILVIDLDFHRIDPSGGHEVTTIDGQS